MRSWFQSSYDDSDLGTKWSHSIANKHRLSLLAHPTFVFQSNSNLVMGEEDV